MRLDDIQNVDDLHRYVHEALCEKENLLENQFETFRSVLKKAEKICGIHFALRGPRNLRLSAVWSADQNLLFFYDAKGERYEKATLPRYLNISST